MKNEEDDEKEFDKIPYNGKAKNLIEKKNELKKTEKLSNKNIIILLYLIRS